MPSDRLEAMRRRDPRPAPGPQHVVVDLTNRCNNNCIACWTRSPLLRDQGPPPAWHEHQLDGAVIRRTLRSLAAMGCEIVRFTGGGEPTLHPDFEDLVALAAGAGMRVAVTTNGTTLRTLSESCLHQLDEVTVSLWCATPQTYARLHPNKTGRTFERLLPELAKIGALGRNDGRPRLVIANVIGMMNHHELEAMLELAVGVGAARVYFAVVDPVPGCTDGLLLSHEVAADLLGRARTAFDRFRGALRIDNEEGFLRRLADNDPLAGRYDRQAVDEVPCLVGWGFLRIMADGHVVPCCRAVAKPMGDLNHSSFGEIWSSARYQEFRAHADATKTDPYFADIRCDLTCDNLMHNREWAAALAPRVGPDETPAAEAGPAGEDRDGRSLGRDS